MIALIGSRKDRGFLIPHTSVGTPQTANKARIHLNYLSRAHRSSLIAKSELAPDGRFGYLLVPEEVTQQLQYLHMHCREGCKPLLTLFINGTVPAPVSKSLAKLLQMFSTEHAVCTALPYIHSVTILKFVSTSSTPHTYDMESLATLKDDCPEVYACLSNLASLSTVSHVDLCFHAQWYESSFWFRIANFAYLQYSIQKMIHMIVHHKINRLHGL